MKKKYFDLHVFFSRNHGYSVPIMIESDEELSEDEIIAYALANDLLEETDSNQVDYVLEIDEVEYNQIKN